MFLIKNDNTFRFKLNLDTIFHLAKNVRDSTHMKMQLRWAVNNPGTCMSGHCEEIRINSTNVCRNISPICIVSNFSNYTHPYPWQTFLCQKKTRLSHATNLWIFLIAGCCIYEKPRLFGESSSDDSDGDDCTDHCHGHKKKCFPHDDKDASQPDGSSGGPSASHDPSGAAGMPFVFSWITC